MVKAQSQRAAQMQQRTASSKHQATSNKQQATRNAGKARRVACTKGKVGVGVVNYARTGGGSQAAWGLGQGMPRPLRPSLPSAQRTSARESATQPSIFSRDSVGLCPVAAAARRHPSSHTRPRAEPHLLALPAEMPEKRTCRAETRSPLPSRPLTHRMPPPQCLRINLSEVAAHVWRWRIRTRDQERERGGEGWRSMLHLDAPVARSWQWRALTPSCHHHAELSFSGAHAASPSSNIIVALGPKSGQPQPIPTSSTHELPGSRASGLAGSSPRPSHAASLLHLDLPRVPSPTPPGYLGDLLLLSADAPHLGMGADSDPDTGP